MPEKSLITCYGIFKLILHLPALSRGISECEKSTLMAVIYLGCQPVWRDNQF